MSEPLFAAGSPRESSRIAELLRQETVGGVLLLVATALALVAANNGSAYADLRDTVVGPASLHLDLSIGAWASDGLLALFFFLVGVELKREFVAGDLSDSRRAVLPIVAAVGGMVGPALIYLAVNHDGAVHGWAVPTATDIAFALAVLAVIGTHLPAGLRTFLLTLAVVDDLLAIAIIAFVYSNGIDIRLLGLAALPLLGFAALVRRGIQSWWLLLPLAGLTWALVHASGVHATVAGVLLGLTIPVLGSTGTAERFEHALRPLSAGFAVPVFAFFAAGVPLTGLGEAVRSPITVGVATGLVAGKTIGVFGTTWLAATFTQAELDDGLSWLDVLGVAVLGGIGFTVALLIGELAFDGGSPEATLGVLLGSAASAILAAAILGSRNRHYRRMAEN
jgi:NhaA family Na+:H+ antiporter